MLERIIGVFKLDAQTFEEIEHDQTATGQAAMIVGVVAVLSALGGAIGATFTDGAVTDELVTGFVGTFGGWIVWSALTLWIGTRLFDGVADMGEMMRVIGFAYAPQMLGIIPCLGWIVGAIWSLVAVFIAVRQGLDLDNVKTFVTIIIGFIAYLVLVALLSLLFGSGAGSLI